MKLIPPLIGVIHPRPSHGQVVADRRSWEMASIAGHELDHKHPPLHGEVPFVEQKVVGGIGREIEVQVAVLLVAHRDNTADSTLADG